MPRTSMNIRIDSDVKKQAQQLFSELGLDMSTAVNIFLRQSIREKSIPFELRLNTPNQITLAALEESEKMIEEVNTPTFSSVDDLFEDLNA